KEFDQAHRRDIIASELEYATIQPAPAPGVLDARRVKPAWWDDDPELWTDDWSEVSGTVDTWDSSQWMDTKEAAKELA
ncbi:MAG TPA: hypothetical protein VMK12_32010, partial [Anaeromyxobacteraceae bacterium]|nr:hypothetical protein [Anaeromyxobacteraceae bacterium]